MATRIRNILLSGIIAVLLCSPALIGFCEGLGMSLPSWLTAADAAYLSGGIVTANLAPVANLEGFESGDFQETAEDAVGNCVPAKALALLGNAAWQHAAISASNTLFDWPCYPAYYGASIVDVRTGGGRLMEMPETMSDSFIKSCERVRGALSSFAERHRDTRVLAYVGPDSQNVEDAPAANLMSDPFTYEALDGILGEGSTPYEWIDGTVSYEEFLADWHKADHHWTAEGAYQAYLRMASALGFSDEALVPDGIVVYEEPLFMGTFARRGLTTAYADELVDLVFSDYPDVSVDIDGKESSIEDLDHREAYAAGKWGQNAFSSRYAEYFHTDYELITIVNEENASGRNLLIVADSYSNCMERFLAAHYDMTYVLDPRHYEGTLDEFLAANEGIEDVLFIMRAPNFLANATTKVLE